MTQGPNILLAEDQRDDVVLVRLALRYAGVAHHLSVVKDGEEALAYLAGEGRYADRERFPFPQLFLLDLQMPVVNGFDVIARVRRNPAFKELPVVVLTASSLSPDVSRAYRLGANSFLTKPSELKQLSAALREVVQFFVEKPIPHC